jgi:hypothetical protein
MTTKTYLLNIARIAICLLILLQSNGKALAFKTDGPDIHAEITSEALPFIRPDIMDDITDEADLEDIGNANDPDHHFDDCHFVGSTYKINDNLENARIDANPKAFDSGDLADKWGQMIHTAEDFYSHSNWVDTGQTTLIEPGVGFWNGLSPYSIHDGAMIVEGEEEHPLGPDSSLSLDSNNKTVTVSTGSNPPDGLPKNTNFPGIISGTWPSNSSDHCPDNVTLSHGDLNKDTPEASLFLFEPAYDLATQQTRQEWCRLLHVSRDEYGIAGPAALLGLWVKPGGNPHPADTQCAPVDPGPFEVVASISNIQIIEDEDDGAGNLNFVFLLINQNLEQSVRTEVANSLSIDEPKNVPGDQLPGTLRMCVKNTDTVAVSLQAWDDDDGPDGEFNNSYPGAPNADDPLDGVTISLGPGFSAGTQTVSSDNLKVTFSVASNTTDSDGDGLGDCYEQALGTLPNNPDTDNDGLKDGIEVNGSNPTKPLIADSDNDALLDGIEDANHNGTWDSGETNPNNPDTDQDILQDGCEVLGSNPTKPLDSDSDDDSLLDGVEDTNHNCTLDPNETNPNDPDSDDDGLNDGFEVANGTNPLDADSDDDGISDGKDVEWIQGSINTLPDNVFQGTGNRTAILSQLDAIEVLVSKGKLTQAVNELKLLRTHVDGCGASADGNDWIVECTAQIKIRTYIDLLISNLTN